MFVPALAGFQRESRVGKYECVTLNVTRKWPHARSFRSFLRVFWSYLRIGIVQVIGCHKQTSRGVSWNSLSGLLELGLLHKVRLSQSAQNLVSCRRYWDLLNKAGVAPRVILVFYDLHHPSQFPSPTYLFPSFLSLCPFFFIPSFHFFTTFPLHNYLQSKLYSIKIINWSYNPITFEQYVPLQRWRCISGMINTTLPLGKWWTHLLHDAFLLRYSAGKIPSGYG